MAGTATTVFITIFAIMASHDLMTSATLTCPQCTGITKPDVTKTADPVAFSAQLTSTVTLKKGHHLVYDKVLTNLGNGYDPKTGIFTCPEAGVYVFHLHALPTNNETFWLQLHHNKKAVLSVHGTKAHYQTGNTAILELKKNTTVYVTAHRRSSLNAGKHRRFNTFSGFILH